MLLAAMLLAGCYDYDQLETVEDAPVDILSRFNAEGKAWMTLQIPLGNQTMTRTAFDDGSDDEWKVKDVYILIFAGSSEATAKFASAYKVENPGLAPSAYEQITRTVTFTINDANINTGDRLYVFALLNNNASAITTSSFPATSVTFANGGSSVTLTGGLSLASDLNSIKIANLKDSEGYFLMTNATLADEASTSAGLSTLVEVPATYFFSTQADAEANPAGHINVERLAAKTTVESGISTYYILGNSYATFVSGDLEWAIDNYNTSSYAYRHLSAVSYPRFVETSAIESHYPLRYRTYWGEDANYAGNSGLTYVDHSAYNADNSAISWSSLGSGYPQYCAENTFDVSHQQDDCSTSVLVRLQLNAGGDFYTTSVTGQDIIFQPPSTPLTEEGTSASSSFVRTRSSQVTYDGTNIATIDDYLRTWLMQQSSALRQWVRDYAGNEPRHITIAVSGNAATGLATGTIGQTAQESTSAGYAKFATEIDAYSGTDGKTLQAYLQALLNSLTIRFYDDGYCYYRVLIRHFGNTETPWRSVPAMNGSGTDEAYKFDYTTGTAFTGTTDEITAAKSLAYLGRYGMVRNNWYNISINSVTHVGSPIIPALTQDADDQVEQLLNATLRISGWEGHEMILQ